MPCEVLQGGILNVRANDFLQVVINGTVAGQLWRSMPGMLSLPSNVCPDAAENASVILIVSTYGRDNFYVTGTDEALHKGVLGGVVIKSERGSHLELTDWYATAHK